MKENVSTAFTWTVREDDSEWWPHQAAPEQAISQPVSRWAERRLAILVTVLFLLLACVWWRVRQVRYQTTERPVLENAAILAMPGLEAQEAEWLRWVAPSLAEAAQQTLDAQSAPELAGLQRAAQNEQVSELSSLGVQTLETAHFAIRHRAIDAAAVQEAAPKLDRLYEGLRRDFGLPDADFFPYLTIDLATGGLANGYSVNVTRRAITVVSPFTTATSSGQRGATALYQSVVYPLAGLMLIDVEAYHRTHWQDDFRAWEPMMGALRLWALWETDAPFANGREQIVRWLYQNAQAEPVSSRQALPGEPARLCRTYSLWGISPALMNIPLSCDDGDINLWTPWHYPTMPTRLGGIAKGQQEPTAEASHSTVALETIIEYVDATYGRASLQRLIEAWGEHSDWQRLIPALFGTSAAEFEMGWQTYLENQYGSDAK